MDTARLLAIDDVHLAAPPTTVADMVAFYTELIGLEHVSDESVGEEVMFRGYPHGGPRLIVNLIQERAARTLRRQVLIRIASLTDCADQMTERRTPFVWLHGWSFYDRRLTAVDPGGNRVELVASHVF